MVLLFIYLLPHPHAPTLLLFVCLLVLGSFVIFVVVVILLICSVNHLIFPFAIVNVYMLLTFSSHSYTSILTALVFPILVNC